MFFSPKLVVLIVSATTLASFTTTRPSASHNRNVAQLEARISLIATQLATLRDNIELFPSTGGSLFNALNIHADATSLITTIKGATTEATANGALGEDDARTLLTYVKALEPPIVSALTGIVLALPIPDFVALILPITDPAAVIHQDLYNLKAATVSFASVLVSIAPANFVDEATTLQTNIIAAFEPAIAAYSD
ncbi:hydrophobic surface binding protein [Mycena filopes]|nr:hydrophobic surface binding protein [Mycena filopes]